MLITIIVVSDLDNSNLKSTKQLRLIVNAIKERKSVNIYYLKTLSDDWLSLCSLFSYRKPVNFLLSNKW